MKLLRLLIRVKVMKQSYLSHDQRYLAYGSKGLATFSCSVHVYDLINKTLLTYNFAPNDIYTEVYSVAGLEFSEDGKRLFVSIYNGGIKYIDLMNGSVHDVAGSANLGSSHIELASDGFMYVSNGTALKGFDPNLPNPTITKTISGIPNPLTNVSFFSDNYAIYTLPHQVDGMNYNEPFKAMGCFPLKDYKNVQSSNGSLPSITNNYVKIKTTDNVTVNSGKSAVFKAGKEILLQPGFEAQLNSDFTAIIEGCPDFTPEDCGSTYRIGKFENDDFVELSKNISATPNPTNGEILVTLNIENLESSNGGIYDSKGNIVMRILPELIRKNKFDLNISSLPSGLYFIKIHNDENVFVEKLIKN
jgi:hypothetical protein